ncbi:YhcH/YjgK/YiaL family protein [Spirochaeta isovalerica]|uniref:YhcH/YjgK/YiaL family protein n=1 Tax=Spirochaeta isovalerica TaxID=150 RepID=A0A841RAM8_9SPIO|nr:YhcH/YjgK/YiaL family protein [Spirochaeta isovalerica]MBB6479979.1 YhcH/YjgK/YiaL family protein [Spirochaeta isovalerica]
MLFDSLKKIRRYEVLHEALPAAFDFLEKSDLSSLKEGRYEIDGDRVFALVQEYDTLSSEQKMMESHRKYMDLQIPISGSEEMGFAYPEQVREIQAYDETVDIALFKPESYQTFRVDAGSFAIFHPGELHMPGCSVVSKGSEKVRKIVIKVKI